MSDEKDRLENMMAGLDMFLPLVDGSRNRHEVLDNLHLRGNIDDVDISKYLDDINIHLTTQIIAANPHLAARKAKCWEIELNLPNKIIGQLGLFDDSARVLNLAIKGDVLSITMAVRMERMRYDQSSANVVFRQVLIRMDDGE